MARGYKRKAKAFNKAATTDDSSRSEKSEGLRTPLTTSSEIVDEGRSDSDAQASTSAGATSGLDVPPSQTLETVAESQASPSLTAMAPGEYLIDSAKDFSTLIIDGRVPVPFRLVNYSPSRLYSHHLLVTGYVKNGEDDYLLTTVEYTSGGRPGYKSCWKRMGDGCKKDCCKKIPNIFGKVKTQVLSLREEVSGKRSIYLAINVDDPDDPNIRTDRCPPKNIIEMPEAESVLWNPERIEQCLGRFKESVLQFPVHEVETSEAIFVRRLKDLDNDHRDHELFRKIATRVQAIHGESQWSANHNSCEHLVNFLLYGRHHSEQLKKAGCDRLILLHVLGSIGEIHVCCRLPFIWQGFMFFDSKEAPGIAGYVKSQLPLGVVTLWVPSVLAIALGGMMIDNAPLTYVYVVIGIYVIEFLPSAFIICGMIKLEQQGRTEDCGRVWLQVLSRSTLNAFAISVGSLVGHWYMRCTPSIGDEVVLSSALFLFSCLVISPLFSACLDMLLRRCNAMSAGVVVFFSILLGPIILLGPYVIRVILGK